MTDIGHNPSHEIQIGPPNETLGWTTYRRKGYITCKDVLNESRWATEYSKAVCDHEKSITRAKTTFYDKHSKTLKRWLCGLKFWLLFHRTGVWFPAPTQLYATVCNSSSRGSDILFCPPWHHMHVVYRHPGRPSTHIHTDSLFWDAMWGKWNHCLIKSL